MTLAAGMVLEDSVLLFADTLHSNGQTKIYGTKLFNWSGHGAHVGFALAGNALLARMVIDDCLEALDGRKRQLTHAQVLATIRPVIQNAYIQHVDQRPLPERRSCAFELLIGISADGDKPRLYASNETVLAPVEHYECIGNGSEIARYMIECGHDPLAPELVFDFNERAITLALQTLVAAKEHVDGVGGDSQFLLVERNRATNVIPFNTRKVEQLARAYQHYATSLLSVLADDCDDSFADAMLGGFMDLAKSTRKQWKQAVFPPELRKLADYLQRKADERNRETNKGRRLRSLSPPKPLSQRSIKPKPKVRAPSRA